MTSVSSFFSTVSMDRKAITAKMAAKILDESIFRDLLQRDRREDHALKVANAMVDGSFHALMPLVFFCVAGKFHLVDGQHRLRGQVISGLSQSYVVLVYNFTDLTAARAAFMEFYKGLPHRSCDLVSPSVRDEIGITPDQAQKFVAAAGVIVKGMTIQGFKSATPPEQRDAMARHFAKGARIARDTILSVGQQYMKRYWNRPCLAPMMATFMSDDPAVIADARNFWRSVVNEDAPQSPLTVKAREFRMAQPNLNHGPAQEVLDTWIDCWNTHRGVKTGSMRHGRVIPLADVPDDIIDFAPLAASLSSAKVVSLV